MIKKDEPGDENEDKLPCRENVENNVEEMRNDNLNGETW